MSAQKVLNRRTFIKEALLSAVVGGSVATVITAGGEQGATGPAGPNQPGTTNALPRWTNGPGGILGDSALSDDGTSIISSEQIIPLTDNAIALGISTKRFSQIGISTGAASGSILKSDANGIGSWAIPASLNLLSGTLTSPKIPKANGANNLTDSIIQDDGTAIKPVTDGASDLGTSLLGWRKIYLSLSGGGVGGTLDSPSVNKIETQNLSPTSDTGFSLGSNALRWNTVFAKFIDSRPSSGSSDLTLITSSAVIPNSDNSINLGNLNNRWNTVKALFIDSRPASGSADLTLTPSTAVVPGSDAAKDLGTSGARWRDLYLSRRAIVAGKNALVLDGQSMTQSSHTVSNADTDIATYSLGANSYTRVIVRVTGYVSFVTLSTNQSINLKIKDGTTQVGNTMVVDGALSASASIPFALEAAFVETSAVTLHFTEGAAAADANTTVFINSIVVVAES